MTPPPQFPLGSEPGGQNITPSHLSCQCFGKQQKREISHFIVRRKVTKPMLVTVISSSAMMAVFGILRSYRESGNYKVKRGMHVVQTSTQLWDIGNQQESASLAGKEMRSVLHLSSSQLPASIFRHWFYLSCSMKREELTPPCPSLSAFANSEYSEGGRERVLHYICYSNVHSRTKDHLVPDLLFNFLSMSSSQIICSS